MDSPIEEWHYWDRTKLRMLPAQQFQSIMIKRGTIYYRISWKNKAFMHRLVLLTWIGELELAKKMWDEERARHIFWATDFEDLLFSLLICKESGSGYKHPEFKRIIDYLLLDNEEAFEFSTVPLSKLLEMDTPHFSSIDGLISADFEKHELERIAKMVPAKYHEELRLPIILLERVDRYEESYKVVGTKLENMLLQRLLKLTGTPFEKYAEVEEIRELESVSMLRRRRFQSIYKVLPETSSIWLTTTQNYPFSY